MKQILILQILVLAAVALISAAFSGLAGFWSAVAGGFSYLIPSAFAVLLLKLSKCNPLYHGKAFIIGEVLKSSAVAGNDACRIRSLASVFDILSVLVRIARCQPFGFFSIVESEALWQVTKLLLLITSRTTCKV